MSVRPSRSTFIPCLIAKERSSVILRNGFSPVCNDSRRASKTRVLNHLLAASSSPLTSLCEVTEFSSLFLLFSSLFTGSFSASNCAKRSRLIGCAFSAFLTGFFLLSFGLASSFFGCSSTGVDAGVSSTINSDGLTLSILVSTTEVILGFSNSVAETCEP